MNAPIDTLLRSATGRECREIDVRRRAIAAYEAMPPTTPHVLAALAAERDRLEEVQATLIRVQAVAGPTEAEIDGEVERARVEAHERIDAARKYRDETAERANAARQTLRAEPDYRALADRIHAQHEEAIRALPSYRAMVDADREARSAAGRYDTVAVQAPCDTLTAGDCYYGYGDDASAPRIAAAHRIVLRRIDAARQHRSE